MLQTLIILLDAIILFLFFRAMYRKILMTPINKFVENLKTPCPAEFFRALSYR